MNGFANFFYCTLLVMNLTADEFLFDLDGVGVEQIAADIGNFIFLVRSNHLFIKHRTQVNIRKTTGSDNPYLPTITWQIEITAGRQR